LKITWLGHPCFLIEGDGTRIITDPYDPEVLTLPPIPDHADIVIRSSPDDRAHCRADLVGGNPAIVTATEIVARPATVRGLTISAAGSRESVSAVPSPRDNAMYRFELGEIKIAHFGDVGNRLGSEQLRFLEGADVTLVPAGGPPTIELKDLFEACRTLAFPLIIPMHFRIPGARPRMLPVSDFASLFAPSEVERANACEVEIDGSLPRRATRLIILNSRMSEASCKQ
jgi:L-ascorbate metabolism protein UlaG (beta-lactamase superfamily)